MVPEIADDYMEIDKATHWGFNMKDGPFKTWDLIGVEKSVAKMKEEGFKIPKWVEKRLKEGKTTFYTEENRHFTDYIKL
jgi:3-hydroxyacyl-CoA dehydrogenase